MLKVDFGSRGQSGVPDVYSTLNSTLAHFKSGNFEKFKLSKKLELNFKNSPIPKFTSIVEGICKNPVLLVLCLNYQTSHWTSGPKAQNQFCAPFWHILQTWISISYKPQEL